jgi:hypothetical protein
MSQRWNGSIWNTLTNPNEGGELTDVSCGSATSCIAVHAMGAPEEGLKPQLWNGEKWTIIPAPHPAELTSPALRDISCVSSSFCIAVGRVGAGGARTLAERWNGTEWGILSSPFESGGENVLNAVSCTSSTSCTAIGLKGGKAVALRWNGTEWSALAAPKVASNFSADISCTAANACTALPGNSATAERYNGTEWTAATLPAPAGGSSPQMYGVSCASETACVAVGRYTGSGQRTLAERWNGSIWSVQTTPNPSGELFSANLRGVSCITPNKCTAVGDYDQVKGEFKTLAERYE